ncbi:MAG TPA: hypothetical protein VMW64_00785 [Dehalococcoidia bacterium]|nr:hypothetical protein [Dehalococcoidia bacterium]
MREGSIRGLEVFEREFAALPGSYPIKVVTGERVAANRATFKYIGPAQNLYVCWGLKKGDGDFNNGNNLEAGVFASAVIAVPLATAEVSLDRTFSAVLTITSAMRASYYDTYIWISRTNTSIEADFLAIDTDAGIVQIMTQAVTNLEVAYAKV